MARVLERVPEAHVTWKRTQVVLARTAGAARRGVQQRRCGGGADRSLSLPGFAQSEAARRAGGGWGSTPAAAGGAAPGGSRRGGPRPGSSSAASGVRGVPAPGVLPRDHANHWYRRRGQLLVYLRLPTAGTLGLRSDRRREKRDGRRRSRRGPSGCTARDRRSSDAERRGPRRLVPGLARRADRGGVHHRLQLVFPYRGVYVRHVGDDEAVAEANQVLFFNAGEATGSAIRCPAATPA